MMSRSSLWSTWLILATAVIIVGCEEGSIDTSHLIDPSTCDQIRCGEKICALIDGKPVCLCPQGFFEDDTGQCRSIPDMDLNNDLGSDRGGVDDPCDPNPCTGDGRGRCVMEEGQVTAICLCDEELVEDQESGLCVNNDPCSPNPCEELGRGTCVVDVSEEDMSELFRCICDEGFIEDEISGRCFADSPCEPNPCQEPGRGLCMAVMDGDEDGEQITCLCNEGWVEDAVTGQCIIEGPCEPNPCLEEGRSVCVASGDDIRCECDEGRVEESVGGRCIIQGLCEPNPCEETGRGLCVIEGDTARCDCDEGRVEDDMTGECIVDHPCEPNPCREPGRGVCVAEQDTVMCLCDEGWIEDALTETCIIPMTGLCEESHFDGDIFEPNECFLEATHLMPQLSQQHSISPPGDHDWFRLDAIPHHIYAFTVERDTLPNAILSLYDQSGTRLIYSQSSTYEITHEFSEGGSYFYWVRAYNQRQAGSYHALVTDLGLDDHGDDGETATPIIVDADPIDGLIETRGDDDWFSFDATEGRIYQVELSLGTLSGSYLYLYRPDSQRIAQSHSTPQVITYEIDEPGMWYIRVRHQSASGRGSYLISVSEREADDHADEQLGATEISVDAAPTRGEIETRGDVDFFRLTTEINHVYQVTLVPSGIDRGQLRLYTPDGEFDRLVTQEQFTFEADRSGDWWIEVRHASSIGLGDYTLTVFDLGEDDHSDGVIGATEVIADGPSMQGRIETTGDLDYFTAHLLADQVYRLESSGLDVHMTLIDREGNAELTATGGDVLHLSIDQSGYYFIEIRSDIYTRTGDYQLMLID